MIHISVLEIFPYKIENHDDDDVELQHSAMTRSLCVRYFTFLHISGDILFNSTLSTTTTMPFNKDEVNTLFVGNGKNIVGWGFKSDTLKVFVRRKF